MIKRRILVVLALVAIVLPMLVAAQAPEGLSTPCAALSWAGTTVGLVAILGVLESWAVEYIPQWPNLLSRWKRPILVGMAFGASAIVLALKAYLCSAPITLQTLWDAALAAGGVFTVSQLWAGKNLVGSRNSRLLNSRIQ